MYAGAACTAGVLSSNEHVDCDPPVVNPDRIYAGAVTESDFGYWHRLAVLVLHGNKVDESSTSGAGVDHAHRCITGAADRQSSQGRRANQALLEVPRVGPLMLVYAVGDGDYGIRRFSRQAVIRACKTVELKGLVR